jgi:hypothetical protein
MSILAVKRPAVFGPSAAAALLLLAVLALSARCAIAAAVEAARVSPEDARRFAEAGHPMYIEAARPPIAAEEEEEYQRNEPDRRVQEDGACTMRVVAVKVSEYDVDYKGGDFQVGVTPIYRPDNLDDKIGKWWWDWAVFRGSNYERSYGTMMIEYNPQESITFGFSWTQSYYPITGGYVPTFFHVQTLSQKRQRAP